MKLKEDFDFGFSAMDDEEFKKPIKQTYEERIGEIATDRDIAIRKMNELYQAILPLINNLIDTADKSDNIHWPNRKEKLGKFKKKLDAIVSVEEIDK